MGERCETDHDPSDRLRPCNSGVSPGAAEPRGSPTMPAFDLGQSIPPDTAHAVSVSLPTWSANVGYEEGETWVVSRMTTGYPRFFVHKSIDAFAEDIVARHGPPGPGWQALLFPTRDIASRCLAFVKVRSGPSAQDQLHVVNLVLDTARPQAHRLAPLSPAISAVICSRATYPHAKQYWQHTGDGVSSRRAEFCHGLFRDGLLVVDDRTQPNSTAFNTKPCRGPRRYQRPLSVDATVNSAKPAAPASPSYDHRVTGDSQETSRFLEERFGRNLDLSFIERARSAIRRRIAGALAAELDPSSVSPPDMRLNTRGVANLREDDIYLHPCGMNAIFNAHRTLLAARGAYKSINFGFPYVDTLKILQKFGPGCVFYGRGSEQELDDLELRLKGGERFLALFCEFPGNPLLTCPNLVRIRHLADQYDFAVVVDETIGTFANINVLQFADIVVSSLTKIFSGDCNVMGGSAILNPDRRYYAELKAVSERQYEDVYWPEDVIFMERNSRDFASRIERINMNAEAICGVLASNRLVKKVYYPKLNESRANYDVCKLPTGGYGGLLSVTFHCRPQAVAFYDAIETAKGPSLGTNFTLTSPYVLLAHYQELDWAAELGVDPGLIRISVGLEETDHLIAIFRSALKTAESPTKAQGEGGGDKQIASNSKD